MALKAWGGPLNLSLLPENFLLTSQDLVLERYSLVIGLQNFVLLHQNFPMLGHHSHRVDLLGISSDVLFLMDPTHIRRSTITGSDTMLIGVGSWTPLLISQLIDCVCRGRLL